LLGVIPVLPLDRSVRTILFIAVLALMYTSLYISAPIFAVWHVSLVPSEKRANFFSLQSMGGTFLNTLLTVFGSLALDAITGGFTRYAGIIALRVVAVGFFVFEFKNFRRVRSTFTANRSHQKLRKILAEPLRNRRFLVITATVCLWNFGALFAGQFFSVYLLEDIGLSYTFLSFMSVINIPLFFVTAPVWNKAIEKWSWYRTLSIASALYTLCYVFNMLVTKSTVFFYIISLICCYSLTMGVQTTLANLPYLNMPEGSNRNAYYSFYAAAVGLSGIASGWAGASFIMRTQGISFSLFSLTITNRQYICLVQFACVITFSALMFALSRYDKGDGRNKRIIR